MATNDTIRTESIFIDDLAESLAAAAATRPYATRDALERAAFEAEMTSGGTFSSGDAVND